MNYCSIQDAWGNNNYISDQYKNYDKQNYNDNEKMYNDNKQNYNDNKQNYNEQNYNEQNYNDNKLIEHFNTNINYNASNNFTCDDYFNHVQSCAKCRNKFKNNISAHIIQKLKNIFYNNKDNIILLLLILFFVILIKFILLFFK